MSSEYYVSAKRNPRRFQNHINPVKFSPSIIRFIFAFLFLHVRHQHFSTLDGYSASAASLTYKVGNFDGNTKILINDKEAVTELVSVNEMRVALPARKFGGIGNAKVQAVMLDGRKTNLLTY